MPDTYSYKYCEIYQLSILPAPKDGKTLTFNPNVEEGEIRIVITSDIEGYADWLDRRNAIFGIVAVSGVPKGTTFEEWAKQVLPAKIEKEAISRKKRLSENGAFVIFEGQGSIEIDFKDRKVHRFGNLLFGYDLIDEIPIGSTLRTARDRFFAAVNISNPNFSDSKFIVRGSSFIKDGGQELFFFRISGGPVRLSVSKPLDDKRVKEIYDFWHIIQNESTLDRIYKLLSMSSDIEQDVFKRYINAWTALEILINKLYNDYKKETLQSLINNSKRKTELILLDKVKKYLNQDSNFGFLDKFNFIVDILFDNPSEKSDKFKKFKNQRDDIFHGKAIGISDNELPFAEIHDFTLDILREHLLK
jgi:hypothetical protein